MTLQEITLAVKGLRWMTPEQGAFFYDLVLNNDVHNILELGFYHGVSTMYLAAALAQKGGKGKVVSIDKQSIRELVPNIESLAQTTGLSHLIDPVYAETDYIWELGKILNSPERPKFDMVFIDGAHLWKTDGLAFFLCDKMLKKDGWLIFDDLKWSMVKDIDPKNSGWTDKYSEDEKATQQVQMVFDLLVKEHPCYDHFKEENGFGFARKVSEEPVNQVKESVAIKPVPVTREMLLKSIGKKS